MSPLSWGKLPDPRARFAPTSFVFFCSLVPYLTTHAKMNEEANPGIWGFTLEKKAQIKARSTLDLHFTCLLMMVFFGM
jgi:hypothetical protein